MTPNSPSSHVLIELIVPAAHPVVRLVSLTDREQHWSGTGSKLLHALGNSNLTTDCLPAGCNLIMHQSSICKVAVTWT